MLYKCCIVLGTLLTMPAVIGVLMAYATQDAGQLLFGLFVVWLYVVGTIFLSPLFVLVLLYLPSLIAVFCFWRRPTAGRTWLFWAAVNAYTLMPCFLLFLAMHLRTSQPVIGIAHFFQRLLHL